MGWGDLLGGIGAVAQGANQGFMFERELQAKKDLAKQQEELRAMLGQLTAGSRERVAEIGADAKRDVADRNARTALAVRELTINGDLQKINTKGEWDTKVQELRNQGKINEVEAEGLYRTNIAEINRQIQAAHDASNERRTERSSQATENAATTAAGARVESERLSQEGQNRRADLDRPIKQYGQELRRYPRMGNQRLRRGEQPKPFGPSYEQYLGLSGPPGAADINLDQAARRQSGVPPTVAPGTTAPPPQAAPGASGWTRPFMTPGSVGHPTFAPPREMFAPSTAMPPAPAAPPPPAAAAAAPPMNMMTSTQQSVTTPILDRSLGDVGVMPMGALAPGLTGGRTLPVEAKPSTESERMSQQVDDLISKIQEAEAQGDFAKGRNLRQILRDMRKQ